MKVDMHIHTTASDGQYTPSEIAGKAAALKLEFFAITDHDTVAGIAEGRAAAQELRIRMIPGIEISTFDTEEIHMLGYQIDEKNKSLTAKCEEFAMEREGRGKRVCDYLNEIGIPVDWQEILEIAAGANISRPHFAAWLQQHGYVKERKDAFKKYLDTPEFHKATDRKLPTPYEAIALIHEAGGKAVLAHPGLLRMLPKEQKELICRCREHGLDGLECYYGRHSKEQTAYYLQIAKGLNLKVTAGSDFHGEKVKPDVVMGMEIDGNQTELGF